MLWSWIFGIKKECHLTISIYDAECFHNSTISRIVDQYPYLIFVSDTILLSCVNDYYSLSVCLHILCKLYGLNRNGNIQVRDWLPCGRIYKFYNERAWIRWWNWYSQYYFVNSFWKLPCTTKPVYGEGDSLTWLKVGTTQITITFHIGKASYILYTTFNVNRLVCNELLWVCIKE